MKTKLKTIALYSAIFSSVLLPSTLFAENILPTQKSISTPLSEVATDRIIIRLRAGEDDLSDPSRRAMKLAELSQRAGLELGYERSMSGRSHVLSMRNRLPAQVMQGLLNRFRQAPDVEYVEPDVILQSMRVPNDTFYNAYQWNYHASAVEPGAINLPGAWDVTTGSANVVISVIDTGILPHADLNGRTVAGYDFISTAFVGNDGNGRDADPTDSGDWAAYGECYSGSPARNSSWHGTHVAGTIGASSDNGYGVAGVNWNSKIQPVRVLGKCGGYTSDIADAIRWSAGLTVAGVPDNATPAQVINMSLGGGYACAANGAMQLAINDASANGAVIVVAAGNSNMDAANFTPAGCANVIAVAANNRYASKAYYSNYGSTVEIAAPGGESPLLPDGILSTLDAGSTTAIGDNVFAFYQGTSMAAPHVAGVVSLMASAYYEQTGTLPSADLLQQKLLESARAFPAGSNCTTTLCGAGIVDAAAAVAAMVAAIPAVEPAPEPEPTPEPVPEPTAEETVVEENAVPVSNDITLVTEKNTAVTSRFIATDADGDSLIYTIVVAPTNGSVTYDSSTGDFIYTPKRRFTGSDSFSYIASDAVSSSMPASVEITINGGGGKSGGGKPADDGTKKGGPKK